MTPAFQPFGLAHLITVAIVLAVIALAVVPASRGRVEAARAKGRGIGYLLLGYYLLESVLRVGWLGVPAAWVLPFDVCGALFFVGAYGHLSGSRVAHEIVFFWTFTGTLHALITPTPLAGFPSVEYVRYFACHGLLILNAFYVLFALRIPLTFGAVLRSFFALQLLIAVAALADWSLGQNFLFLRAKPPSPTLFDSFGPWPGYIGVADAVALGSSLFWWLVFRWRRATA